MNKYITVPSEALSAKPIVNKKAKKKRENRDSSCELWIVPVKIELAQIQTKKPDGSCDRLEQHNELQEKCIMKSRQQ